MTLKSRLLQKKNKLIGYRAHLSRRMVTARERLLKKAHLLPHLCTLGNAFFGFCSLTASASGNPITASYFILFGTLLDGIDGRLARYIGSSSNFGVELDSLADALTFCVAPAFLMYKAFLYKIGLLGFFSVSYFFLAGLIRLARFNITHDQQKTFFIGLPTTIAGCFLASAALNPLIRSNLGAQAFFLAFVIVLLGSLMVSKLPFPTGKQHGVKARPIYLMLILVLVAALVILERVNLLFFLFLIYFSYALFSALQSFGRLFFRESLKK